MLRKQIYQKNVIFVTIGILKILVYRIYFWYMSKDDAINKMTGSNLVDKKGVL